MANISVDATAVMLHSVPTWLFFYRGKRLGRAAGWRSLGQFEAAVVVARETIRAANVVGSTAKGEKSGKSSTD
ncbi:hypothetical protein [Paraburkholderia aspalathi]|uniref:hypothetical protein n=1 Tax=Paraburkholderia aspalathi TaxID=1324617 RepID=UPI0038BA3F1B